MSPFPVKLPSAMYASGVTVKASKPSITVPSQTALPITATVSSMVSTRSFSSAILASSSSAVRLVWIVPSGSMGSSSPDLPVVSSEAASSEGDCASVSEELPDAVSVFSADDDSETDDASVPEPAVLVKAPSPAVSVCSAGTVVLPVVEVVVSAEDAVGAADTPETPETVSTVFLLTDAAGVPSEAGSTVPVVSRAASSDTIFEVCPSANAVMLPEISSDAARTTDKADLNFFISTPPVRNSIQGPYDLLFWPAVFLSCFTLSHPAFSGSRRPIGVFLCFRCTDAPQTNATIRRAGLR